MVDCQVAQIGNHAVHAATGHFDLLEWWRPDTALKPAT